MYAIYGNIYHQYTPNVSIYTIHGSVMGNENHDEYPAVSYLQRWTIGPSDQGRESTAENMTHFCRST